MNIIFDGVDTDFKPDSSKLEDSILLQGENNSLKVKKDDLLPLMQHVDWNPYGAFQNS